VLGFCSSHEDVKNTRKAYGGTAVVYEIEPYVGVGPIRFGMTREQVHATIVGERKPTLHRGREKPGDFFPALELFVDYRAPGICEFVEFALSSPLSPTLQNQAFLGQSYRVARAWFEASDPDLETHGAGLISKRFGIALYAGSAEKEPDEPVEAVAVFEKGYYDQP
jgi:hypothetical protein